MLCITAITISLALLQCAVKACSLGPPDIKEHLTEGRHHHLLWLRLQKCTAVWHSIQLDCRQPYNIGGLLAFFRSHIEAHAHCAASEKREKFSMPLAFSQISILGLEALRPHSAYWYCAKTEGWSLVKQRGEEARRITGKIRQNFLKMPREWGSVSLVLAEVTADKDQWSEL